MSTDHFIAARVSPETKARLKTLAARRHLSESALLKELLDLTLGGLAVPEPDSAEQLIRVARHARLYVRLRPDDQLLLAERAAALRMAAATYVSVLVRAHLRHLAPLPKDELHALNRVVAQLGAIGRNLNQIARAVHQSTPPAEPRRTDVQIMLKICEALRDHVKALLKQNAESWKVGYAEPRP
ncbi:MAG: plasmid mobilization relaxosome protein MobC [Steroidobacteraceae bacterium]